MTIVITKYASEHHHEEVVRLVTSIQQKEFNLPITYEDQPDLMDIYSFFDVFLVALHENRVVGTIGIKIMDDFGILRKMFVAEGFRGSSKSIAQKLLESLEGEVVARGIEKIYFGTTEFFKAAHRFYERNNYAEIGRARLPSEFPIMKIDTRFYCKELGQRA